MYWNTGTFTGRAPRWMINSNMRCIETVQTVAGPVHVAGLIVTWDVLKRSSTCRTCRWLTRLIVTWDVLKLGHRRNQWLRSMINSNMRCIETRRGDSHSRTGRRINSNMRCIETAIVELLVYLQIRLIVTWDVLKLTKPEYKELPSTD